ncbi:MAG TPA: MarR family winged helix-turn-helix transcriptional regulator [Gemmatimonadaceae bacterium]|nr:MarR family winged helix-turn-helix transcriptional regulator [Gemmatimonadaceae bacterium]
MTLVDQLRIRKAQQFALLRELYERRDGAPIDPMPLAEQLGIDQGQALRAMRYSEEEGLIGRDAANSDRVVLTPYGHSVMETAVARPNESTEHFPPMATLALPAGAVDAGAEPPAKGDVRAA